MKNPHSPLLPISPTLPLSFSSLGLSTKALEALNKKGIHTPTPIQEKIIPLILKNHSDIIGQSQTGTGKTAAFGVPLLEKISEHPKSGIQVLVLVPTRELALQVSNEIQSLKGDRKIEIVAVYGGQSMGQQIGQFKRGVHIVVGTPGRILDHIRRKTLNLNHVQHVVLDEADEMLNMGFIEDVEEILAETNKDKKVLLFSATMPARILSLARNYMNNYEMVKMTPKELTTHLVEQTYYKVLPHHRFEALCRIIDKEESFYGLVFCRTKMDVEEVAKCLDERRYLAAGIHGDISQPQREKILRNFRDKKINILVATDVAARGIDIQNLGFVVNFSLPQNPEAYVHRIGRTGRSGRKGKAMSLVTPEDIRQLGFIKRITQCEIRQEKLPTINELIKIKRNRLQKNLQQNLEASLDEIGSEFLSWAGEILQDQNPQHVLAILLQNFYQHELDKMAYIDIPIEPLYSENKGSSRSSRQNDRSQYSKNGNRNQRWEKGGYSRGTSRGAARGASKDASKDSSRRSAKKTTRSAFKNTGR